jgi:hypothetical protein
MKPTANDATAPTPARVDARRPANAIARPPTSIVTRMICAAAPAQVWDGLMFYEQIDEPPPLRLRLLLPLPIRTEGPNSAVGDESVCIYEGGHLRKRITRIEPERHYGFDVVEQNLAIGRGLTLCGGCYTLRELAGGRTEVAVTTRYVSRKQPAWLWRPVEATVCHMFHRHLLASIRRRIEPR